MGAIRPSHTLRSTPSTGHGDRFPRRSAAPAGRHGGPPRDRLRKGSNHPGPARTNDLGQNRPAGWGQFGLATGSDRARPCPLSTTAKGLQVMAFDRARVTCVRPAGSAAGPRPRSVCSSPPGCRPGTASSRRWWDGRPLQPSRVLHLAYRLLMSSAPVLSACAVAAPETVVANSPGFPCRSSSEISLPLVG